MKFSGILSTLAICAVAHAQAEQGMSLQAKTYAHSIFDNTLSSFFLPMGALLT